MTENHTQHHLSEKTRLSNIYPYLQEDEAGDCPIVFWGRPNSLLGSSLLAAVAELLHLNQVFGEV